MNNDMAIKTKRQEHYMFTALNGMAYGFFCSFVVGTLLKQMGLILNISHLVNWGQTAINLMGPAIGISVGYAIQAKGLNLVSTCLAGAIGAGTIQLNSGQMNIQSGNPMTTFLAVMIAVEIIKLIQDKIPLDIFIIPIISMMIAGLINIYIGPYIGQLSVWLGEWINKSIMMQPLLMGMTVSLLMGIAASAPLFSVALGMMLGLEGLAAGAALAGCCAHMIGFATMSIMDNSIGDVLAIAIGSSILQFKNILQKPIIWIPPILTSIITGALSTVVFQIKCSTIGASLGMTGFIGLLESIQLMGISSLVGLILVDIVIPIFICWSMYRILRKLNYIKNQDLKITHI